MANKKRVRTDGGRGLSSNPFAGLGAALGERALEDGPEPAAVPETLQAVAPEDALGGKIVVRREKKGRGGKTATIVAGIRMDGGELEALAKRLRKELGCGAHVEGETIVVGGAQTDRVRRWLEALGANRVVVGN